VSRERPDVNFGGNFMKKMILLFMLFLPRLVFSLQGDLSPDREIFMAIEEDGQLSRYLISQPIQTDTPDVYKANFTFKPSGMPDEAFIKSFKWSRNGEYIVIHALVGYMPMLYIYKEVAPEERWNRPMGELIKSVSLGLLAPSGLLYSWSPDDQYLACVNAPYVEEIEVPHFGRTGSFSLMMPIFFIIDAKSLTSDVILKKTLYEWPVTIEHVGGKLSPLALCHPCWDRDGSHILIVDTETYDDDALVECDDRQFMYSQVILEWDAAQNSVRALVDIDPLLLGKRSYVFRYDDVFSNYVCDEKQFPVAVDTYKNDTKICEDQLDVRIDIADYVDNDYNSGAEELEPGNLVIKKSVSGRFVDMLFRHEVGKITSRRLTHRKMPYYRK